MISAQSRPLRLYILSDLHFGIVLPWFQLAPGAAGIDWHGRVPVVGFDGIETGSTEGHLFQGGMLLALSILPAVSLFHFWHVTLTSRVAPTADLKASIPSIWDWSHFGWNDPARICSDADATSPCLHNSTVLPGLEPTLLAILTAVGLLALVAHLYAVFGPHPGGEVEPRLVI